MSRYIKVFAAVLLLLTGVAFTIYWEVYAKEKIDSVEVIIASQPIGFKEQLTEENIQVVNVRRSAAVDNRFTVESYQALIGKYASVKIEKGTQLYTELIDTHDLVPDTNKGEFVAPIPNEWLFAVPGSLRRTYIADIYVIGDKEKAVIDSLLKDAREENDKTDEENIEDVVVESESISEPILKNVRVSSVKDQNNQEVQNSEENQQATGSVSNLEVIADEEMFETIRTYAEQGFKLYVVYKFERGQDLASLGESEVDEE